MSERLHPIDACARFCAKKKADIGTQKERDRFPKRRIDPAYVSLLQLPEALPAAALAIVTPVEAVEQVPHEFAVLFAQAFAVT